MNMEEKIKTNGVQVNGASRSLHHNSPLASYDDAGKKRPRRVLGGAASAGAAYHCDHQAVRAAFPTVYEVREEEEDLAMRKRQTVVSDLDGTLLRGSSSFPYFMALAWEASGPARFGALLALAPVAWVLYHLVSEEAAIRLLIFVSCAGVPEASLQSAARAALPKLYLDDLHPATWRVFSRFGRRCVLTANPRFMVEPFACEFLGADLVIGSELQFTAGGVATGLVKPPGVAVGRNKLLAMKRHFGEDVPDVGLGDRPSDSPFMSMCKEGYVVPRTPKVDPVPQHELPKPIIFHDGRLVKKPTPLWALAILIWMPIGFVLALIRVAAGALLPMSIVYHAFWALGVRVVVKGTPPPPVRKGSNEHGVLFVCTHKTLLDPIFISCALGRPVSAVTYSLSRVSELISPIRTVRLSRDRETDAANIRKLLAEGDLVICPEGTTCREPFLLRFSALFAQLTDHIVPVAMNNRMGMFHATTARGWKGMDCFYFFMNPSPMYEITFLRELPKDSTCVGGKSSFEVANYIQKVLAATLNFECTSFTRKDKYKALASNDGSVSSPKQ